MEIYCLSCKDFTKSKNSKERITKNHKPYIMAICDISNKL